MQRFQVHSMQLPNLLVFTEVCSSPLPGIALKSFCMSRSKQSICILVWPGLLWTNDSEVKGSADSTFNCTAQNTVSKINIPTLKRWLELYSLDGKEKSIKCVYFPCLNTWKLCRILAFSHPRHRISATFESPYYEWMFHWSGISFLSQMKMTVGSKRQAVILLNYFLQKPNWKHKALT